MALSNDKINTWKRAYGKIYKLKVGNEFYVYRSLNVRECEAVQTLLLVEKEYEIADYVVKNTVLYPEELKLEDMPAGAIDVLAKNIISSAGFFDQEKFQELLKSTREEVDRNMENDFFQWKMIIMSTLQGYKLEDLNRMDLREFFKLIRICENLRGEQFVVTGDDQPIRHQRQAPEDPFPVQINEDGNVVPDLPNAPNVDPNAKHKDKILLSPNVMSQIAQIEEGNE